MIHSLITNPNAQFVFIVFLAGLITGLAIGYRKLRRYRRKADRETKAALTLINRNVIECDAKVTEFISSASGVGRTSKPCK